MSSALPYTVIQGVRCYSPELASSYADYPDEGFDITDRDGESSFWVRSRNRLFKRLVSDLCVPDRKTKVLEIGCGTGGFIRHLRDDRSLEITGSEIYLKGLLYAKKNIPDVDFIQLDVSMGEIGEKFDLIIGFDVLEHIEDDVAAIANIGKMLPVGGNVILTVPQHMFLWSQLDEIVRHKRRYSRSEMLGKLRGSGFAVTFATSFVFFLFPLMLVSRLLDKGRDGTQSDEQALEKRVKFPALLNWLFDRLMRVDEYLIGRGVSLPYGGTLVVVAKKL